MPTSCLLPDRGPPCSPAVRPEDCPPGLAIHPNFAFWGTPGSGPHSSSALQGGRLHFLGLGAGVPGGRKEKDVLPAVSAGGLACRHLGPGPGPAFVPPTATGCGEHLTSYVAGVPMTKGAPQRSGRLRAAGGRLPCPGTQVWCRLHGHGFSFVPYPGQNLLCSTWPRFQVKPSQTALKFRADAAHSWSAASRHQLCLWRKQLLPDPGPLGEAWHFGPGRAHLPGLTCPRNSLSLLLPRPPNPHVSGRSDPILSRRFAPSLGQHRGVPWSRSTVLLEIGQEKLHKENRVSGPAGWLWRPRPAGQGPV